MGKQESKEWALYRNFVFHVVVEDAKCLEVSLNIFCLMSKSALKINIIVLCFIV
jgi:hypothetical protein